MPLGVEQEEDSDKLFTSYGRWRELLGDLFFGLTREVAGSPKKYRPTFRSLFSYFIRRHADAGFHEAHKHYKNQTAVDYQVNLSYLFHIDWRISQEWQDIRDQEKSIKALRAALKQGALGGELIESSGKLRTQLAISEKERDQLRQRLDSFHVIEDHHRLEEEASQITQEINDLSDEGSIDAVLIRELRETIAREKPPPHRDIKRLYSQAGIELPGLALKRFEAVEKFHNSVVQNRRSFLEGEISAAEERTLRRRARQSELDRRRAEIMRVLQTSGALQQYGTLQTELSRLETHTVAIANKYELARQLEGKNSELTMKRARLSRRLQQDLDERKSVLSDAILTFEAISEELYESPGSLTIDATENGPEFGTNIQARRSVGKNSMQIFCFDMTLAILNANHRMPGFLIHDSHLFDGADERQIAKALSIGARKAEEHGFQYIVTMNSDDLPRTQELPEGFNLNDYINEVRLTDSSEDGGLFGFRFD